MGFFDPFGGAADVGELKSDLSSVKSDVETHTNNNDIHVTASDKSNWNSKLDKNQGTENSGKVLGTNANGEVIPLNGYGFEYDEETKMLKYGTDPTSNLNQGIGLDDTLSKKGYAADAGAVGELKGDLTYSNKGLQTFKGFGNFQHYGLKTDGSFLTSQKYRVSNNDPMTFDRPLTVYVSNGFKWGYLFFYGGTATWKGWYTAPATIPKGTSFVVQIARVTENYSEIANVDEFLSAVTFENAVANNVDRINPQLPKTFVSSDFIRGSWENGHVNNWNKRLCTALYHVTQGNKFLYSVGKGLDVSIAIFNDDMSTQYFSGWMTPTGENEYEFTNDGLFALQIRKTISEDITPSEYSGDCKLFYGIVDSVENRLENAEDSIAEINSIIRTGTKPYSYVGERIPSRINYFDVSKILTMSYSGTTATSQDIECFDDYLFVSFSGTEQIKVYSLSTHSLIASIEVEVQHGTGMQFSNEYYDPNDPFPLLYVGGWASNQTNVIRITNDNDVWGATIIRKLIIPNTEGYYLAPSIDADHNTLYAYGYSINSNQAVSGNSMKLIKADLSNLTDNGDGTYTPKILSSVENPYVGVTQGRKFFGGNLYVGFSNNGTPHNARLVAIDATSGDVKTDVSMSGVTTSENEGVCYQIVDSEIIWYYSDYYNVFKVLF